MSLNISNKICRKCGEIFLYIFRIRGEGDKKRINIDCKKCVRKDDKIRDLRKNAPPIPRFDCCGQSPLKPYVPNINNMFRS